MMRRYLLCRIFGHPRAGRLPLQQPYGRPHYLCDRCSVEVTADGLYVHRAPGRGWATDRGRRARRQRAIDSRYHRFGGDWIGRR